MLNKNRLVCSNLGDSGLMLIRFDERSGRPFSIVETKELQHQSTLMGSTPFQITRLPTNTDIEFLRAKGRYNELNLLKKALANNQFCNDQPEDSELYQLKIKDGDLVILATDGVFDNLFKKEIL